MTNYRAARLVLGTHSASTYTEIKRAFRKRALELHPDRNPSPRAEREFATLVKAYKFLMNYRSPYQVDRYKDKLNRFGRKLALVPTKETQCNSRP